jgi:hypothetical protein
VGRNGKLTILEPFEEAGNDSLLAIQTAEKNTLRFCVIIEVYQIFSWTKKATENGVVPASH